MHSRTLDLARVEAAEVFLELTRESVGHSMRCKKVMGRAPQDDLDLSTDVHAYLEFTIEMHHQRGGKVREGPQKRRSPLNRMLHNF